MSTTTTSTVTMPAQLSSSSLILSAGADMDGRVVRFDSECIVIPEQSMRRKTSKTYSLPLWKKRAPASDSEGEASTSATGRSRSPREDTHVVFKVHIPRFISRSPSRGRSTSTSPPAPKPLTPCLVYRTPSSLPSSTSIPNSIQKPKAVRRTSLPMTSRKDELARTVPLRACCVDCVPITEECLEEGEEWQEKFTRGARRRRSLSLDNAESQGRGLHRSGSRGSSGHDVSVPHLHTVGFATDGDGEPGSPLLRPSAFALTVDEVDKRRKSLEFADEELLRFRSSSPSSSPSAPRATPVFHSPHAPYSGAPYPRPLNSPLLRLQNEASTSSTTSTSSLSSTTSDLTAQAQELTIPPRRPKSSPIQEEDEDQLFPLPSPRRTPSNSPSPSANSSPAPSPNNSTPCLAPPCSGAAASSSKESLAEESMLARSLSRKSAGNGLLSPQRAETTAPALSLQSSALSVSLDSSSAYEHTRSFTAPGPSSTSNSKPRPVPITIPDPMRANSIPVLPTPSPQHLPVSLSTSKQKPLPIPPSTSAEPRTSTRNTSSPSTSPSISRAAFPLALSSSPSLSRSPLSSPNIGREKSEKGEKGRRPSFSLPALKDAIKGASADVLKGVSTMGGGGMSV